MTKQQLKSLTIQQLNNMSEDELTKTANEVIQTLSDSEINNLPTEVKEKLEIKKESSWVKTLIALIISALIMSIFQLIAGK